MGWAGAVVLAGVLTVASSSGPTLPPLALPAGVAVAWASLAGPRKWPVATLAGLVSLMTAYLVTGRPPAQSAGIAAIQAASALLVAWLLRLARVHRIGTLVDILWFGCIVIVAGALAAGGIGLLLPAQTPLWPFWWLMTSVGIALPAPGLLCATQWWPPRRWGQVLEATLLLTAVVGLTVLAYPVAGAVVPGRPGYLLLPLLLWIGLRFGLRAVSLVVTLVATALIPDELVLGWPAASASSWPIHVVTVTASMTGLLLLYAVALLEEKRRVGERQLLANQEFVRSLLSNSPALVAVTRYDGQGNSALTMLSPTLLELLDSNEEDLLDRSWIEAIGPGAGGQAQREDLQVLQSRRSQVFVQRLGPRGHRRTLMTTKFPLRLPESGGRAVGMIALDVTEHRRLDRIMRLTFDLSPVPMARLAVSDEKVGAILDANEALGDLLGLPPAQLRGKDLRHCLHPDERDVAWSPGVASAEGRGTAREVRVVNGAGQTLWVAVTISVVHGGGDRDEDAFALAVMEDVTDRHEAEQTLTYQARHDALTGLPNRYALVERLEAALQRLWGTPTYVGVLFCDLDGFKTLNDTLSHRAGDEVLTGVAERLRGAVRPQDTVARLGGDEFVVIAEGVTTPAEAAELGERLCASLRAPFRVQGRDVGLSLSVGVSVTTDPQTSSADLLRQADLAMYRAKDAGRNRVESYVDTLEVAAIARMKSQEYLRAAIAGGAVRMEYQPIVSLNGAGVTALEALVRIPSPTPVSTAEFIGVAEENGLMGALGGEVLRLVLADIASWHRRNLQVRLHLNVSVTQLSERSFPEQAFERVMAAAIHPGDICFEVGDCPQLRSDPEPVRGLLRLRELGFRIGIDGFGAGHAGLASLKVLAADYVKIDRSFIGRLAEDREDRVIVEAMIRVAHDLGRRVIATGVETPAQVDVLRALGCDEIQGYIHSAAVPAGRVPDLVAGMPGEQGAPAGHDPQPQLVDEPTRPKGS